MRILVIDPNPSFGGGMERFSLNLAAALSARGHSIFLAYEHAGTMLVDYRAFISGELATRLPGFPLRRPLQTLKQLIVLSRFIFRNDIELVFSSHLSFIRVGAALRCITGREAFFHLGLPVTFSPLSTRLAFNMVTGIGPAAHTLDTWRQRGWPSSRLFQVRNWVDPNIFAPSANRITLREKLGISSRDRLIVYVGRITKDKGSELLIDAFLPIHSKYDNIHLILIGKRDNNINIPAIDRIRHYVPTSRPQDAYAAADIAVVPSTGPDTFPLALLEAMSSSTLVLATPTGAMPDVLGAENSDLLIRPANSTTLTELLDRWIQDDERRIHRAKNLRSRVVALYGPDDAVAKYEELFLERR
jgi:glycosyltransferase involved in cell wall biosynthesis